MSLVTFLLSGVVLFISFLNTTAQVSGTKQSTPAAGVPSTSSIPGIPSNIEETTWKGETPSEDIRLDLKANGNVAYEIGAADEALTRNWTGEGTWKQSGKDISINVALKEMFSSSLTPDTETRSIKAKLMADGSIQGTETETVDGKSTKRPWKVTFDASEYAFTLARRGDARHKLGDDIGAIIQLTEAIAYLPVFGDAYYLRGRIRVDNGQLDLAEADFIKAIELNPTSAAAHGDLGLVQLRTRKDADGRKNIDEAILLDKSLRIQLDEIVAKIMQARGNSAANQPDVPAAGIAGTTWDYAPVVGGEYRMDFRPDGSLHYTQTSLSVGDMIHTRKIDPRRTESTWKQNGNKITFWIDGIEIRGIISGPVMREDGSAADGKPGNPIERWTATLLKEQIQKPAISPAIQTPNPEPKKVAAVAKSLLGTTWDYVSSSKALPGYKLEFRVNNVVHYTELPSEWDRTIDLFGFTDKTTPKKTYAQGDGTWKQDGDKITFRLGRSVTDEKGMINGDHMTGAPLMFSDGTVSAFAEWTANQIIKPVPSSAVTPLLSAVREQPKPATISASLANTTWEFTNDQGEKFTWMWAFTAKGIVETRDRIANKAEGTWTQSGNMVQIKASASAGAYTFTGTIKDDRIDGISDYGGKLTNWTAVMKPR